jgi:hypothetical protein
MSAERKRFALFCPFQLMGIWQKSGAITKKIALYHHLCYHKGAALLWAGLLG